MASTLLRIPASLAAVTVGLLVLGGSVATGGVALADPTPTFTTYTTPTANSYPAGIVAGPDGNLWFTESHGDSIGKVTPAGVITEYPLTTPNAGPTGITVGPDGNLWFTEHSVDKVAKITPAGVITEYPLTADADPEGIVTGSDGNLWIAEFGLAAIGVVSPSGVVQHDYPIGTDDDPTWVVLGSDDRVWFSQDNVDSVGAMDTTGTVSQYATTQPAYYLAEGADGNVWFSGATSHHLGGTITPAGVVTDLPAVNQLFSMTAGPDSDIWGDNAASGEIDEVDASGSVVASSSYLGVIDSGSISFVTEGPDGNIWFTAGDDHVGVLNLHPAAIAPPVTGAPSAAPTLAATGVGQGTWILGGIAIAALLAGLVAVGVAGQRRRRLT